VHVHFYYIFKLRVKIGYFCCNVTLDGGSGVGERLVLEIKGVKSDMIVTANGNRLPNADGEDPRSPIPSVLVSWFASEGEVLWECKAMFLLEVLCLLQIIVG
jgi:hypothetical protein